MTITLLKGFLIREIRCQTSSLMSAINARKTHPTHGITKGMIRERYHTLRGMLIAYAAISPEYIGGLGVQGFVVEWAGQAIFGPEWAAIKATVESTLDTHEEVTIMNNHYVYGKNYRGTIHLISFDETVRYPNPAALCGKRGGLSRGDETISGAQATCKRCRAIAKVPGT